MNVNDTIAAVSTAQAEAAIGIVRMSGPASAAILGAVFVSKGAQEAQNRRMTYGHVADPATGARIDEVMAVFLSGPATYTRQDMVEIYCHGGVVATGRVLELLLAHGARLAEPGEFTLRAFVNGRIDLTQAESIVDLVKSKTSRAFDCALEQLDGGTSDRVRGVIAQLVDLLAGITVSIDYPEEDVEDVSWETIRRGLESSILSIDGLLANAEHSRFLRDGAKIAIIGLPNVGKSSLMNLLLGEVRAIVTEIPGTTRDTIEETLNIGGYPVRLIDTAGIRATDDEVERIGVERAKSAANRADMVVYVLDASKPLSDDDRELLDVAAGENCLVVANKSDRGVACELSEYEDRGISSVVVSVKKSPEEAFEKVYAALELFLKRGARSSDAMINVRHQQLLTQSRAVLAEALAGSEYDLVEVDIREAINLLGKIVGENIDSEILRTIFSKFCLGK